MATGKFREDLYYRLSGIQIMMPALRERTKDDIYLLFRKFSSDFAEKYGLCKINLSHEAINSLTSYRWPGNIRQLKNIAQTITALESRPLSAGSERVEISPETLVSYIPQDSGALMVSPAAENGGSMSDDDRQRIISAIYVLKQEVDRLRGIVEAGNYRREQAVTMPQLPEPEGGIAQEPERRAPEAEAAPEQMSIRKINDDLIEKCLARHGGKVKPAAAELGISERTIYRKLAEKKNSK